LSSRLLVAEVSLTQPVRARERATTRERFLTPAMLVGLGLVILFMVFFDDGYVEHDGLYYYAFARKLIGIHTPAEAYQFGSAYWTAPFIALSQLVALRGRFDYYHAGEIGTMLASNTAALLILYLGWRILRELDLPRGPAVLLLTLFGTPLFYYATMRPSYKHAADTLYVTAAFWFLLRAWKDPRRRYLVGAGCCLGLALSTRYVNVTLFAGVVVMFAGVRAWRSLRYVVAVAALTAAFLYLLPVVRGIPYTRPPDLPFSTTPGALAPDGPFGSTAQSVRVASAANIRHLPGFAQVHLSFTAPVKMLFTLHRGVFLWTPLTALGTVGFILLVKRDRRHRWYLLGLAASAFTLLEGHMLYGALWAGGGSFSQRFLTALWPFFLIGTAELVRRWRWRSIAALSLCVTWSVFLALVLVLGYNGINPNDGLVQIVPHYTGPINRGYDSMGHFAHNLHGYLSRRWELLQTLPD
jgi:hypothetical protein